MVLSYSWKDNVLSPNHCDSSVHKNNSGWTGCHNLWPNIHISFDNCISCCTLRCRPTLFFDKKPKRKLSIVDRTSGLPAFPSTTAQLTGIHVQSNECQYISPASSCYASMLTSSYSLLCIHRSRADTPCPLCKNFPNIFQFTSSDQHRTVGLLTCMTTKTLANPKRVNHVLSMLL